MRSLCDGGWTLKSAYSWAGWTEQEENCSKCLVSFRGDGFGTKHIFLSGLCLKRESSICTSQKSNSSTVGLKVWWTCKTCLIPNMSFSFLPSAFTEEHQRAALKQINASVIIIVVKNSACIRRGGLYMLHSSWYVLSWETFPKKLHVISHLGWIAPLCCPTTGYKFLLRKATESSLLMLKPWACMVNPQLTNCQSTWHLNVNM